MKINEEFSSDPLGHLKNAKDANEFAMEGIWDMFIEPIGEDNLSEEQQIALAVIGSVLKEIANKAYQFEQMESGQFYKN